MSESNTRRTFLKQTSAAVAAAPLISTIASRSYAAGGGVLRLALIGCGGRGTGAGDDALSTTHPLKIVALADAFGFRLEGALNTLKAKHGDKVDVPTDRQFVGLDAYKKAIDSGVDGVILATPPGFRPAQFEYAVQQGKHVFMEKPVATDAPGVRRVMEGNKIAKQKNLKVGVGLQRHHQAPYIETVKRVQDGAIGDIVYFRCYWNGGPVWVRDRATLAQNLGRQPTEMEYQVNNWYYFNWLSGDHIVEQHIHNIDVCNWVKGAHPIAAQGMGGRQVRSGETGQIYDHHAVEFIYDDDVRMISQCRQINDTATSVSEHVHGTKGYANLSGVIETKDGQRWRAPKTERDKANPYVVEHHDLWEAVLQNKTYNEADFGAESTMTAILGRMASYSGKLLRYDAALAKGAAIFPPDDKVAFDAQPPVLPSADGRYPVPMPGEYDPYVSG